MSQSFAKPAGEHPVDDMICADRFVWRDMVENAGDTGVRSTGVADRCRLNTSTVRNAVQRLRDKGLAETIKDPEDARRTLHVLTEKGAAEPPKRDDG